MEEVKMYKCDHCGKKYTSKSYCLKHEPICYWNEATKSCITCENFEGEVDHCGERNCTKGKNIIYKLKTDCALYNQKTNI